MGLPDQGRVVVLLYPGCTVAETIELVTRLKASGRDVVHAAPDFGAFRDQSDLTISPDKTIAEIDHAAVNAVIIPGGDPGAIVDNDEVVGLLSSVADGGGIVAGICAGVLVMASAGLLAGRSITHNYRSPWAPPEVVDFVADRWLGARVEADPEVGVVVDENLITALPNATAEFATTVCRELGLYTAEQAAQMTRHLRGEHVAEMYGHGG